MKSDLIPDCHSSWAPGKVYTNDEEVSEEVDDSETRMHIEVRGNYAMSKLLLSGL